MKKEKGWTITTFEVTVKHRTGETRKWLAEDLVDTMRERDEIKAVRAKVQRKGGDEKVIREAHTQMRYALEYVREVRKHLLEKLINPRKRSILKMWSIDLIDDLWLATMALDDLVKKSKGVK